jgi:hypothetical protein
MQVQDEQAMDGSGSVRFWFAGLGAFGGVDAD